MWSFYFGWYQGAVYSNLIASGICAGLVWWRARIHLQRQRDAFTARLDADRQAHAERHAVTHRLLAEMHQRMDTAGFDRAPNDGGDT